MNHIPFPISPIFPKLSFNRFKNLIAKIHSQEQNPRDLSQVSLTDLYKYDPTHNGAYASYSSLPLL